MKLIPIKRLRIPCFIRLDDKHIADVVYALEFFHHSERGSNPDFEEAISCIEMNYLKYVDVLVMSDGSIQIAHDQWIEERELMDYPESRLK